MEYLYTPETDEFYFLELNPRLQVEHPCTEMVSKVNLPAAQLQVAMGIPLHQVSGIRTLYGLDKDGGSDIDFANPAKPPRPHGHVIAARITAENPDEVEFAHHSCYPERESWSSSIVSTSCQSHLLHRDLNQVTVQSRSSTFGVVEMCGVTSQWEPLVASMNLQTLNSGTVLLGEKPEMMLERLWCLL